MSIELLCHIFMYYFASFYLHFGLDLTSVWLLDILDNLAEYIIYKCFSEVSV